VLGDPVGFVDPWGLCVGDWWDVPANAIRAWEIFDWAAKAYPGQDDMSDAMRHSEWSQRTANETNLFTAWSIGVANEIHGLARGDSWDSTMMDLHNNQVGRDSGGAINPDNLETLAPNRQPNPSYYY